MNELELRLAALGAEIDYPPTPRFDYSFAEARPAPAGAGGRSPSPSRRSS